MNEIETRISAWSGTTATNVPGTGPTAGGVLDLIRDFSRQLRIEPLPGRLECGRLVPDVLTALADGLTSHTRVPTIGAMWGVPVVVDDGMDPLAWRMLDTDGQVLKQGSVQPA